MREHEGRRDAAHEIGRFADRGFVITDEAVFFVEAVIGPADEFRGGLRFGRAIALIRWGFRSWCRNRHDVAVAMWISHPDAQAQECSRALDLRVIRMSEHREGDFSHEINSNHR